MSGLWQDIVYGLRTLRRQRGYTALALLVLGSAVGLNTTAFTAFNAVLLRPWPVPDAERVVKVVSFGKDPSRRSGLGLAHQRYLSEHATSVHGVAAMQEGGSHDGLAYKHVSGNFFDVLRVPMALGRGFRADEDSAAAPAAVAVLSHAAWQGRFGGRADIVGRTVDVRGLRFTIVGVASREFTGTEPNRRDLWLPLAAMTLLRPHDPAVPAMLTRPDHCCSVVAARLREGVSRDEARAELALLSRRFQSGHGLDERGLALMPTPLIADPKAQVLAVSGVLFAAVTLVLLLACANVGNLVLARGLARRREMAVRISLGAARLRVVRQLMVENLLLASGAGALGITAAFVLPKRLLSTVGGNLGISVRPDLTVLAFTAATVLVACLAFGLAPALHCTRAGTALNERSESSGLRLRLRGALLGIQVAVSVVLLVGTGLLVRGVQHGYRIDPGFVIDGVSVLAVSVDERTYDSERIRALFERLKAELDALPGSPPHGVTRLVPLGTSSQVTRVAVAGAAEERVLLQVVSGGYFDVLGIPILQGRRFAAADEDRPVVVVNESLARRLAQDGAAVGHTITHGKKAVEVIGVVRDVRTTSLDRVDPTMYEPLGRDAHNSVHGLPRILVRDQGGLSAAALIALVARVDPQARANVSRLADNLDEALGASRVGAALAGVVGVFALALTAIGLSGVFAYMVEQRTREIGIRVALGAQGADVIRLVLGSSSRATLAGAGVGLVGAVGAAYALRAFLYGLSPLDPLVYLLVALVLTAAAVVASYVPARRALRVDPTVALRYE